jgi:hypothetical protein
VPDGHHLYAVFIDLDAVQTRLQSGDGSSVTRVHAQMYLHKLGFQQTSWPGKYIGAQRAIDQLHADEVLSTKPIVT